MFKRPPYYFCPVCGVPVTRPYRLNNAAYCSEECANLDVEWVRRSEETNNPAYRDTAS